MLVLAMVAALIGGAIGTSPASAVSERRDEPYYTPKLTVSPNYDGNTRLSMNTLEREDALAAYTPTVVELATGRAIGLGFGYASSFGGAYSYSEFEGPYEVSTVEPLLAGVEYQATLRVTTVGFWACSIYDEDGCSWRDPTDYTYRWRFTYNGATIEGAQYTPPAPVKASSAIQVTSKSKWRQRGWKVTVTLLRDGNPYPNQQVTGQWSTTGGWHRDGKFRTNAAGKVKLSFRGEKKRTRYQLAFAGNSSTKPSTSRTFTVTQRNRSR